MKKSHLVLLIITAVMALFSAYSLAAINQVYDIKFEWFSQYNNNFTSEHRQTNRDDWKLLSYPKSINMQVIKSELDLETFKVGTSIKNNIVGSTDFGKYLLIYCSFGKQYSPEYRIKIINIAQRGNVIEVKVSVNSPSKIEATSDILKDVFYPEDVVRIDKNLFPVKGNLYFVFKNQFGTQLIGNHYDKIK